MGISGSSTASSRLIRRPRRSYETILQALARATGVLLRDPNLDTAVPEALRIIGTAFGADVATMRPYPPTAVPPHAGAPEDDAPIFLTLTLPETDAWSWSTAQSRLRRPAFSLTLPISTNEGPWGTLRLDTVDPHVHWVDEEVGLLEIMADHLGAAIHRSQSDNEADRTASHDAEAAALSNAVLNVVRYAEAAGADLGPLAVARPSGHLAYASPTLLAAVQQSRSVLNAGGGLLALLGDAADRETVRQALATGAELNADVDRAAPMEGRARLHTLPIPSAGDTPVLNLCWLTPIEAGAAPYTDNLRRRVRAERAIVDASSLLVTGEACDYDELLRIVGTATGARYAYLVVVTPSDVVTQRSPDGGGAQTLIEPDTYAQYEWFASPIATSEPAGDPGPTFAVPILSSDDQLYGYLGIEYHSGTQPARDEDARILSVLGDLLCAYLQRKISEEALRRSENRYRHFVDTISEAIWRVEFDVPIPTNTPAPAQVQAFLKRGVVAECNAAMAHLFGKTEPSEVIGRPVAPFLGRMGEPFLHHLVRAGYRLRRHEYGVNTGSSVRMFVINTVGVVEDGRVTAVWGSSTEVTERIDLERRMVASLERQQHRIGHDLHDRIGQQLAGTRMLAQNVAHRYFEETSDGRQDMQTIIDYVNEAVLHVNDMQRSLMPMQVDRDGLSQALTDLASRTDRMEGIDCFFSHDGRGDGVPHETKLQMYRIAQEAVRNALTHGNASLIEMDLRKKDGSVVLVIHDNGDGFDVSEAEAAQGGFGLDSMKYRANAIGARIQMTSSPDDGTRICCTVPLQPRSGAAERPGGASA